MSLTSTLKVKPVTASTWKDFETLFAAKGAPGYCWCMAWRMTKEELKHNNSTSRKKFIKKRVDAKVPIGLLAYATKEPVGWCSLAPRDSYERLGGDEDLEDVWSIACFFVQKEYREQGMVDYFIAQAKKYARKRGAKYLEAYPVDTSSPSYRFMGFVSSFKKAGFEEVKKAGKRRHVMVHKL